MISLAFTAVSAGQVDVERRDLPRVAGPNLNLSALSRMQNEGMKDALLRENFPTDLPLRARAPARTGCSSAANRPAIEPRS